MITAGMIKNETKTTTRWIHPQIASPVAVSAGLVPAAGLGAYSATKAAVAALSDALDIELIGTRVQVSALCPGVINTAIVSTSTMRGEWADRRARTMDFYARRGTSALVRPVSPRLAPCAGRCESPRILRSTGPAGYAVSAS